MKRPAVFLDRDGTINRDVPYCAKPEDFELLPGAGEAVRALNRAGLKVVVVTNQSGVARGYFSEEDLRRVHERMIRDLGTLGARLDAVYYCPHHPDDNCGCRKPKSGLFRRAAEEMDLDLPNSYVVGDSVSDLLAGRAAGCKAVLVGCVPCGSMGSLAECVVTSLAEAVAWILGSRSR